MSSRFRKWLSNIVSPKEPAGTPMETEADTADSAPNEQNGYDDPEYSMNLERTLRVLETSLHNTDNSEEIAIQTMEAVCDFYDADFCGVLDVDLDVGVWTPEIWYEPKLYISRD